MKQSYVIDARWDQEADVWLATSRDVPGLVVEAESWPAMIEEVRLVLPDLLDLSGNAGDRLSLTFRAEQHLDLAAELLVACACLGEIASSRARLPREGLGEQVADSMGLGLVRLQLLVPRARSSAPPVYLPG